MLLSIDTVIQSKLQFLNLFVSCLNLVLKVSLINAQPFNLTN